MHKKGQYEAVADAGATIAIFFILFVFFFLLSFQNSRATYSIEDAEETYGLEATTIALLYAQATVETSKGVMPFGDFIALAFADSTLVQELEEKTNTFFTLYQKNTGIGIGWKIIVLHDTKEKELASGNTYSSITKADFLTKGEFHSPIALLLPHSKPGHFIRIEIRTVTVTSESIIEQYEIEK